MSEKTQSSPISTNLKAEHKRLTRLHDKAEKELEEVLAKNKILANKVKCLEQRAEQLRKTKAEDELEAKKYM